ncbi:hypothetical protein FPV67DRAFT_1458378 [Lyophyllum atratum]|nr:hypothetical protein FPV67DRAFT_1458378 [Lyophyllum atratum]
MTPAPGDTLHGTEAHIDGLLPLLAFGVHLGVWEEDGLPWILGEVDPPLALYKLRIKEEYKNTSISRAVNQPAPDAPAPHTDIRDRGETKKNVPKLTDTNSEAVQTSRGFLPASHEQRRSPPREHGILGT